MGKRNATPQDLSYSRGKLYDRRKKALGTNRHNAEPEDKSAQNAHSKPEVKTGEEVAGDSGVSRAGPEQTNTQGKSRPLKLRGLRHPRRPSRERPLPHHPDHGRASVISLTTPDGWATGKPGTFPKPGIPHIYPTRQFLSRPVR